MSGLPPKRRATHPERRPGPRGQRLALRHIVIAILLASLIVVPILGAIWSMLP